MEFSAPSPVYPKFPSLLPLFPLLSQGIQGCWNTGRAGSCSGSGLSAFPRFFGLRFPSFPGFFFFFWLRPFLFSQNFLGKPDAGGFPFHPRSFLGSFDPSVSSFPWEPELPQLTESRELLETPILGIFPKTSSRGGKSGLGFPLGRCRALFGKRR